MWIWRILENQTSVTDPVDTGCKLNVHKTFRKRPGLLNVLCTFNLRPVSAGDIFTDRNNWDYKLNKMIKKKLQTKKIATRKRKSVDRSWGQEKSFFFTRDLEPVFQFLVLVFTICKGVREILTVDVWCSSFSHLNRAIFERFLLELPGQNVGLFFEYGVKDITRCKSALWKTVSYSIFQVFLNI